MAIKLIVSDLDGTLLNENHKISEVTVKAIRAAENAGIRWLTATGRAWNTAFPLLEEAGVTCDFVLLNGAEFRSSGGRLIQAEAISNREAGKTIRILQEQGIGFELNTESGDYSTDTELCSTASVEPASSMAVMAAR